MEEEKLQNDLEAIGSGTEFQASSDSTQSIKREQARLQNDLEAIESEKQEYLENNSQNNEDEETEGEEIEFGLSEDEIEEWIVKLTQLKVEKNPIELDVDDETTLKINFDENSSEEQDENDELKTEEVIE